MENKCNKTPNSNTKYLDHVYCHTAVGGGPNESKNYIRANNNSGNGGNNNAAAAGADVLALLKENKQLKAMLILHLDLIQEQSDQLMAKDKQLNSHSEELEKLRNKTIQLETHVQDLQKQLQRQLKRVAIGGEISSLPPPPLAKIQCKTEVTAATLPLAAIAATATTTATNNIIGECNGKLISKIILHRVNFSDREGTNSPISTTTTDDTTSEADDVVSRTQHDEDYQDDGEEEEGDEEAGEIECDEEATTEDSNNSSSLSACLKQRRVRSPALLLSRGAKPRRPVLAKSIAGSSTTTTAVNETTAIAATATTVAADTAAATKVNPVKVCVTPPTPSRGKQMPLMLWHTPDMHSDESASCDSMADTEHLSSNVTSPVPAAKLRVGAKKASGGILAPPLAPQHARHAKTRRCSYITTQQMYNTREWEDDEYVCDYEFIKEEANALRAEAPMLEIPKWTEHELTVSYCIEGTEDLSDDTFLKRHAKLEVDEKRRKKWDVQQIREQRRIEKLKRRHCKDEIQPPADQQAPASFYPQADAIQNICYINDIPVQAFGEMIPKLSANNDFALPWLDVALVAIGTNATATCSTVETFSSCNTNTSSAQAQQQLLNSSFVLLKKRKRQQSSSTGITTTRQRNAVAAKAAAQTTAANTVAAAAQLNNTTTHNSAANTTNTNITPTAIQSNTSGDAPK